MARSSIKKVSLLIGAGAFVLAFGIAPARADETVIEKHTEESHSYKVENSAPVVENHDSVVTEHTERTEPSVVEKRTTVETVPAAPVVQRRTTETTVHSED